ncbi:hypothetical protein [Actinokineospora sp. NBRC 105648]|uniref:hypothetical protein n=1 Tax=Actinokineospora sp. NBRC 105648 TaxID=3032206 RepID=UPI0024A344BE|nr:hypothetical protein [Actinokineospora sp. NBRC 105648]GLZ42922.1 hypothetical protein Acsp05_65460 [Actinokineospora sp. NBRC 105648]
MSTGAIIGIIVAVVIVLALVALVAKSSMRSKHLKERFGGEYDRALSEHPKKKEAERELAEREKRHAQLDIKPLSAAERERYTREWAAVQEHFVDRPGEAVEEADSLVTALMADRGYPTDGDHEQRSADLSVRHASTVEDYRTAHEVRARHASGDVSTEELREAIVRYRKLFSDLIADGADDNGDTYEADAAAQRDGHTVRTDGLPAKQVGHRN